MQPFLDVGLSWIKQMRALTLHLGVKHLRATSPGLVGEPQRLACDFVLNPMRAEPRAGSLTGTTLLE